MRHHAILSLSLATALVGCSHAAPGTHVEIVDRDGNITYVAGAAGIGVNKSLACEQAVGRSVSALAIKFTDKNDGIAEEVAKAVGVEDGRVFMQLYAKATALDAAVQDVQFDPTAHQCMAVIRWTPPIFVGRPGSGPRSARPRRPACAPEDCAHPPPMPIGKHGSREGNARMASSRRPLM